MAIRKSLLLNKKELADANRRLAPVMDILKECRSLAYIHYDAKTLKYKRHTLLSIRDKIHDACNRIDELCLSLNTSDEPNLFNRMVGKDVNLYVD